MGIWLAILLTQFTVQKDGAMKGSTNGVKCSGSNLTCSVQNGKWILYVDAGTDAAPVGATFITKTPDATLTSEQAMSLLGTGLVKNTTGTGTQSIYTGTSCASTDVMRGLSAAGVATCYTDPDTCTGTGCNIGYLGIYTDGGITANNLSGTNTGDQTKTCGSGSYITTLGTGTSSVCGSPANAYFGATCFGVCGEDVNFTGSTYANTGTIKGIACSWATAGTGTGTVKVRVWNVSNGTELCTCELGACTSTDAKSCGCAGTLTDGAIYTIQLKSTTDCDVNPTNIVCNVSVQ